MWDEEFGFENLEVYKRSLKLAVELCRIAISFPFKYARIRNQLIGAAISVPLNIAEGYGRKGSKEKTNFYRTAKSSAFEIIPILSIALELELLDNGKYGYYRGEIVEISKMISGLISSKS
jgi:four helix bundle protein